MPGRTRVPIVIGALLALSALAPAVAEAGAWLKPVALNGSTGSSPSVSLDSAGNVVAVWQTNPPSPAAGVVQGARHSIGPTGFTPLPDFSTDTTPMHANRSPVVVTNASGYGLVVWVNDVGGGNNDIQLETIAPDGTTGPLQMVPAGVPTGGYADPVAAMNANGDAVVAWLHNGNEVDAITRQGLSGTFTNVTTPDVLGTSSGSTPPAVAIDGSGNAIAVWDTPAGTIQAKRHAAGASSWTGPDVVLPGSHSYSAPAVAANPTGQMVVAFIDTMGLSVSVSAVSGTVAAGWGLTPTVATLSDPGVTHGPAVVVDGNGGAAVGWSTSSAVQVSLRPAGGAFPAPAGVQSISVPTIPDGVTLGGDGHHDMVVAWWTFDTAISTTNNIALASVKPAGVAAFGAPQVVSDTSVFVSAVPQVALDQSGDAVVVYSAMSGGNPAGVGYDVYEAASPLLGAPAGPATLAQGATGAFSVPQLTDAFSAVSVSWNFGDGSAVAPGAQVTHAFATPGKYAVTVTATNAAGNASSATLSVTVTASGGTPPPPVKRCIVPKLIGETLAQARAALTQANCALGKVHQPKSRRHHRHHKLVVRSSSPPAGSVEPSGTTVAVTLGPPPKPKKRKHK